MAEAVMPQKSPVSRWGQVARELGRRIEQRELLPGEQLPSENELAEMFDVSRLTVRQALSSLARDGYVVRRHGWGTFVSDTFHVVQHDLAIAEPWQERVGASGKSARSRQLGGFIDSDPPASLLEDAGLPRDTTGTQLVSRLQIVDDKPIALSESWIFPEVAPGIEEEPLIDGSLSRTLADRFGVVAHTVHSYVHAENTPTEVAALLECTEDMPLIVVNEVSRDADGDLISCSRTRWIGYRVRFHQINVLEPNTPD